VAVLESQMRTALLVQLALRPDQLRVNEKVTQKDTAAPFSGDLETALLVWTQCQPFCDFVLAPVVFPFQSLEVLKLIATTLAHWPYVIDFPAQFAVRVAIRFPPDQSSKMISSQRRMFGANFRFFPNRLNDWSFEGLSR
jgi:hypothetical protein